ncbi:MAG TPA: type II secretion system protein [Tepidisphaeraceae bacterium]|jgi:prepilin-type N-terminal cleavage/methylation domain-containing protein
MLIAANNISAPAGRAATHARAFTLIELLIVISILGILAMAVVPHVANAAKVARENTLKDELRYLRTAVAVYKAQHQGTGPGVTGDLLKQLTEFTDEAGHTNPTRDAAHRIGPYVGKIPLNPLNSSSEITVSSSSDLSTAINDATGWLYNPTSSQVIANSSGSDTSGLPYAQY